MAGIKKLRYIQMGPEGTKGTEVDATTIWHGTGTIQDDIEPVFVSEDVGYKVPTARTYIPKVGATLELDETPMTFEQSLHIFEMGIETVSATQDGTGPYVYTYPWATATDTADIKTRTVEGGDNAQEEQFYYGFCPEFTLSGVPGEAWMMSGTIRGRQVATGTKTASLSLPSVEEILFSKTTLAIDVATAAFGTTVKTSTLMGATLNAVTGWKEQLTGDGQLYFTFLKNTGAEVTLDVTFEHETTAVAEIAAWRAQTQRNVQLKAIGSVIAGGSDYAGKALVINLSGKWERFEKLGENDGNDIVTGTLRGTYNSDLTTMGNIIVACSLATIT